MSTKTVDRSTDKSKDKSKDPLLTYQLVADLANVEIGTVYQWKKRGIMPEPAPESIGRRPVWRQSAILDFLEASGRRNSLAL